MNTKRNPVGWFEIYVDDMGRAKLFYEKTFGHALERLGDPTDSNVEMWVFPMFEDASGAPGALVKMEGCSSGGGGTLIYFSCADCAIEEARVPEAGGGIVKSKFAIGEYGFISLVTDTEGNMIGLHSME